MSEPIRISPQEARQKVVSGQAHLVCAYDDTEKLKKNHFEGAISFFLSFGHNCPDLPKTVRSFSVPDQRKPVLPVRRQN